MLKKFFLLYKDLSFHLIFVWLILIISFASFYGIRSLENYYENILNDQISECEIVLYLDSRANPEEFQNKLKNLGFIRNIRIDYNSQTLQKLEHNFQLYNLNK